MPNLPAVLKIQPMLRHRAGRSSRVAALAAGIALSTALVTAASCTTGPTKVDRNTTTVSPTSAASTTSTTTTAPGSTTTTTSVPSTVGSTVASSIPTTPPTTPATTVATTVAPPSFATTVFPHMSAAGCFACHGFANTSAASFTFATSNNRSDTTSSNFVRKPTLPPTPPVDANHHGGGTVWPAGGAANLAAIAWINGGRAP